MSRPVVAVIGASEPSAAEVALAERAGELLARRGMVVLTGGLGGVMEAASRGARSAGGLVLGVLPHADAHGCNPHVDIAVATGLGDARNAVIANTAGAFIAVGGGLGTLTEIAFGLKRGKLVVGLSTWQLDPARLPAVNWVQSDSAEAAVDLVCRELRIEG